MWRVPGFRRTDHSGTMSQVRRLWKTSVWLSTVKQRVKICCIQYAHGSRPILAQRRQRLKPTNPAPLGLPKTKADKSSPVLGLPKHAKTKAEAAKSRPIRLTKDRDRKWQIQTYWSYRSQRMKLTNVTPSLYIEPNLILFLSNPYTIPRSLGITKCDLALHLCIRYEFLNRGDWMLQMILALFKCLIN